MYGECIKLTDQQTLSSVGECSLHGKSMNAAFEQTTAFLQGNEIKAALLRSDQTTNNEVMEIENISHGACRGDFIKHNNPSENSCKWHAQDCVDRSPERNKSPQKY